MERVSFVAGDTGEWRIERISAVIGESLPDASRLGRIERDQFTAAPEARWVLDGVRSNERYLTRSEKEQLARVQEGLGRPSSTRAALIPIRKSAAWWALAQDERRAIFEESSHHVAVGLRYLPGVARRLYHCRELGGPFDFLTWFEYGPADASAFEELVGALRDTEEWKYVEREVDLRLSRG
jgi:hypothetical protein